MTSIQRIGGSRRIHRSLAAAAVALGLGGAAAATLIGPSQHSHANAASRQTVRMDDFPYFACVGVLDTYGFCIGPPTN